MNPISFFFCIPPSDFFFPHTLRRANSTLSLFFSLALTPGSLRRTISTSLTRNYSHQFFAAYKIKISGFILPFLAMVSFRRSKAQALELDGILHFSCLHIPFKIKYCSHENRLQRITNVMLLSLAKTGSRVASKASLVPVNPSVILPMIEESTGPNQR